VCCPHLHRLWCEEQPVEATGVPVKVETVTTQEVQPVLRYSGEIRPDTQVQLAFKQAGYVASLHQIRGAEGRMRNVQVGDEVPAGIVLARLRRSDYEALLNQANGQERSMQGSLQALRLNWSRPKLSRQRLILISNALKHFMLRRR
jgi:multidrug efflux pump subunit AcrA (membrane-fusion protein)